MPRKPTGQPPLKAMAVKLPAPLIDEIRRYADIHRKTISDVIREGLELRLHGVQPPSQAPGNPPIPASTVATVAQVAAALTTAAAQLCSLYQSPTAPEAGEQLSTPELSASTWNSAYNGYTSETSAIEPTTERTAEAVETDTSAQTPDAPEPRRATKRGKQKGSPVEPVPELSHDHNTVIQKDDTTHEQQAESAHPSSAVPVRRTLHKLTPRQVKALRAKRARGVPVKALMDEYGVSKATVFRYLAEAPPAAPLASPVPTRRKRQTQPA